MPHAFAQCAAVLQQLRHAQHVLAQHQAAEEAAIRELVDTRGRAADTLRSIQQAQVRSQIIRDLHGHVGLFSLLEQRGGGVGEGHGGLPLWGVFLSLLHTTAEIA